MSHVINLKRSVLVVLTICFVLLTSICTFASDLDSLGNSSNTNSDDNGAISDYLKDYNPVTSDNMASASQLVGPFASAIGTATGIVMILVSAGIFLVTALDLAYIGIPTLRSILNPNYGASQGGGMMGGQQVQSPKKCHVSDEALLAVAQAQGGGGGIASPQMSGGMVGGFGGSMPMGGMSGGMPAPQGQQVPTKSVILTYLKKRMVFLILFAVCSVILTSSILTKCGLNLAELLQKILVKFNGSISSVNV